MLYLCPKKKEGETPLHLFAQPLVHEFEEVFPNDLPLALHPIRGIEHRINLLPRVALPN